MRTGVPGRPEETAHRAGASEPDRTSQGRLLRLGRTTAAGGEYQRRGCAHAGGLAVGEDHGGADREGHPQVGARPDAEHRRRRHPHPVAAVDRRAPPRHHQDRAPGCRECARERAQRAARCAGGRQGNAQGEIDLAGRGTARAGRHSEADRPGHRRDRSIAGGKGKVNSSGLSSDSPRPASIPLPRHVAIVMDGNGRWARARGGVRADGHRAGVEPVRMVIEECVRHDIGALTLFAFSSENWGRPRDEVMSLMSLFVESLEAEIEELHRRGVRVRFIGERDELDARLRTSMASSEQVTAANSRLALQIAVSYGGRSDIVGAARRLALQVERRQLSAAQLDEATFGAALALGDVVDPDLFIRTGGEQRISNFLLWNLAYTELYFTERLWPDFDAAAFEAALQHYAARQRRFGLSTEQIQAAGTGPPGGAR